MHDQPLNQLLTYALITGAATLALVGCFGGLDELAFSWAVEDSLPGDLRALFMSMSFFGHGTGLCFAAILVWTLDTNRKRSISILLGSTVLAGIVATTGNVLTHRPRPFVPSEITGEGVSPNEAVFQNSFQSFPSGHTATAFALSMLYPRAKYVFMSFAVLAGIQRVISQNHFRSGCSCWSDRWNWCSKDGPALCFQERGGLQ